MARYRRYRRRRINKKKWEPNLIKFNNEGFAFLTGNGYNSTVLCTCPIRDSANGINRTYTIKRPTFAFEMEANIQETWQYLENICFYIMFLPQGYSPKYSLPQEHPEWIMSKQFYGSAATDFGEAFSKSIPKKITSRLARTLHSGDQIIFLITYSNTSELSIEGHLSGMLDFYSK